MGRTREAGENYFLILDPMPGSTFSLEGRFATAIPCEKLLKIGGIAEGIKGELSDLSYGEWGPAERGSAFFILDRG
jgi:hypothetical protein